MSDWGFYLDAFHLIRPWCLFALLPVAALWWYWRRRTASQKPVTEGLAPHLAEALMVGARERLRLHPVDVAAICLALLIFAASGPSWTRMPNPFLAQSSPLVVVLKVTPSMLATDIAPTRLERARQKIRDLMALRTGARTALVAYAGTAHRVVPLTDDPRLVEPYLAGLSPEVMPRGGADPGAAISLAREILSGEETPGSIVLVVDSMEGIPSTLDLGDEGYSLAVLAMSPSGLEGFGGIPVIQVTADEQDVRALEREINAAYRQALSRDSNQPWDDRGWVFAWPAALLILLGFRKGFTLGRPPRATALLVLLCMGALAQPSPARADGIADWFFTPDQQGRRAMEQNDFATASERFADPMWKNYALYRQGKYEEAAEGFGQLETAAASFGQAMAQIKNRKYRDAVRSFELTLERDPGYPGASENLETAKQIVEYIEATREASDTGEEAGIGADEVVFDNESGRGADTQVEAAKEGSGLLSADQWMNTVDTRTNDFLRQRFAIEANQEN